MCFAHAPVSAQGNQLGNPKYTVDHLEIIRGADALTARGSNANGIVPTKSGSGITLADGAAVGTIFIKPDGPGFPYNELLPSWNGKAADGSGFRVWLVLESGVNIDAGSWGTVPSSGLPRKQQVQGGVYDIDYLRLSNPASRPPSVRIELYRQGPGGPAPEVSQIALCYTNSTGNQRLFSSKGDKGAVIIPPPGREVGRDVPFRSQVIEPKDWIGRICSPASVGMCVAAFGSKASVDSLANEILDREADLFGVWNRNVQAAAQHGVSGHLARFRTFSAVQEELARGSVICASIRFKFGEIDPANLPPMYQKRGTEGHLVVVKGIDKDGRVIVHDSASKDNGINNRWRQEDLAKAWFDKGGVAYVFTGKPR